MTKRIFRYMVSMVILLLLAGGIAILGTLYSYFGRLQHRQLEAETQLAAAGVEAQGMDYFRDLQFSTTRITWIAADGEVLYDSQADVSGMENHAGRPEVKEALESGTGESSRFSQTMLKQMLYNARRLPDGSVIRVAEPRDTVFNLVMGMIPSLLWLFFGLAILSWFLSKRVSDRVVQPLNQLNIDEPLSNDDEYEEIAPLLRRVYSQQVELEEQKEKLLLSEQDFRVVTENMAEGLVLLNEHAMVLSINGKAKELFGVRGEPIGADILRLERRTEFERALRTAAGGHHEELILPFGGRLYQVDVTPVMEYHRTVGMVVLLFDVTERESSQQMRREFTANVSHELKTPLHTISGCAELLEQGEVRPADQKKFVHLIYTQAQRMTSLVEDVLYISHLDEGADDLKPDPVDLREVAEKTLFNLQQEAQKKGVLFSLSGDRKLVIHANTRLVDSIVYNLVDNAIKYNKDGGRVDVTVERDKNAARLIVADTGIGIPAEDQARIFERFYRVDKSHSREIGGTGLGLAIVKHAVILLHGKINLESKMGEGSRFTVTFPIESK